MKISLIIPAYNEEKYIDDCLEHAVKNGAGKFHEIIVVDNASTDKTAEVAGKFPGVKVVHESAKGLTKARQRGYMESTGDILAYNDADTRLPSYWFDIVNSTFDKDLQEKISGVSGPYFYYDLGVMSKIFVKIYWLFLGLPTYWLTGYMMVGGNFAIRRSVLDKMKGFDTTIAFYGEDTNIARRASEFGKVKFMLSLLMPTSGRRLVKGGVVKTAMVYMLNYLSEAILKKPAGTTYTDFR
jgi:glycosyltransferase involved in cell wall biosynthesis